MSKPILPGSLTWLTPPNDERHAPAYQYFEDSATHPFEHESEGSAFVNACWLADAALLAYSDPDVAAAHFGSADMRVTPFLVGSTQCYVAHDAHKVIVAFRGTRVLKPGATNLSDLAALGFGVLRDWLTDVNVRVVVDGARGGIHGGFLAAFAAVWDDGDGGSPGVANHLRRLTQEAPERRTWFTGHSLGGALATLAASWFEGPAALYTYGSPRVGDTAFRRAFGNRAAFRFVHGGDIVPAVPRVARYGPAHAPGPFVHVGQRFDIRDDGVVLAHDPNERDPAEASDDLHGPLGDALDALSDVWRSAPLYERIADHAPTYYASQLWNAYLAHGDAAVRRSAVDPAAD